MVFFSPSIQSSLFPKDVTYSDFEKNIDKFVHFKPDYIVDYFMEEYETSNKTSKKTTAIGYIGYDIETSKYFGLIVPVKYTDTFEEELNKYLYSSIGDYIPDIPEFYGNLSVMTDDEKKYFKIALYENYHLWNNLAFEYLFTNQIDLENISDEEYNIIEAEIDKLEQDPETLISKTDFYVIRYTSTFERIWLFFASLVILLLVIKAFVKKFVSSKKYYEMNKFKNKIETSTDFTEVDVEQDFNNSLNIGNIWIGNRFIILLADDDIDLHICENIAWAYVYKTKISKTYYYKLFIMDFDGNKNTIVTEKRNYVKLLKSIEEKCPNVCIGYSDELANIANQNINDIKNFDKSTIQPFDTPKLK